MTCTKPAGGSQATEKGMQPKRDKEASRLRGSVDGTSNSPTKERRKQEFRPRYLTLSLWKLRERYFAKTWSDLKDVTNKAQLKRG